MKLIHWCGTGEHRPEDAIIRVSVSGHATRLYSLGRKGTTVTNFISRTFAHKEIIREAVDFNEQGRGVVYWARGADRGKDFEIVKYILYRDGKFLQRPLRGSRVGSANTSASPLRNISRLIEKASELLEEKLIHFGTGETGARQNQRAVAIFIQEIGT